MNFNIKFKPVWLCLAALAATQACTKDFEGLNQRQERISDAGLVYDANEGGFLLPTMMNAVISPTNWIVQIQQNLLHDSYAGYLEPPGDFGGNANPLTYVTKGSTWTQMWSVSAGGVMNNWVQMYKNNIQEKYPDLYAIALILKVAGVHRIVDTYGPYPYLEYGLTAEPKFNTPEECYAAFFEELEWAVTALNEMEAADPDADQIRFAKWERTSLGGEYRNWVKLANTLRLRLAMRISDADPALAQTQAEAAANPANGGLLDPESGGFSFLPPNGNPYEEIINSWSDCRISAAIVSYMDGFHDPRLPAYAKPATDPALNGEYRGIRPGAVRTLKDTYLNFSLPNIQKSTPMKIVDVAESYFLRAEGVLRGWNMGGGTAQELYEEGVRVSIAANGVSGADEYLQSTSTMLPYEDPKFPEYSSPALSDVTVKWDDGLTFDKKLEKIITQKWIAVWPEGAEGWSEFRRTGYPKQFSVSESRNPLLPNGTFIKRATYPETEVVSATPAGYAQALSYLGRDDEDVTFYWMKKD